MKTLEAQYIMTAKPFEIKQLIDKLALNPYATHYSPCVNLLYYTKEYKVVDVLDLSILKKLLRNYLIINIFKYKYKDVLGDIFNIKLSYLTVYVNSKLDLNLTLQLSQLCTRYDSFTLQKLFKINFDLTMKELKDKGYF